MTIYCFDVRLAALYRLLIVLSACTVCSPGVSVVADDGIQSPGVFIVQNVYTKSGQYCVANEITEGLYFFSKPCAEVVLRNQSMSINLASVDGSLQTVGSSSSLIDAGGFFVFDTRPEKSRPDIEGLLTSSTNTTAIWYPDFSREDVVYSEKGLKKMGSGKFGFTQPLTLNASGIVAYKGDSPFCMVEEGGQGCLPLKDLFLSWGGRYSCAYTSKASANLTFNCPAPSHYCHHHCEDGKGCQLTYSSYNEPDRVECQSGAGCFFSHSPDHLKGHCSAGGCAFQQRLWKKSCKDGCSYDTHTAKTLDGSYSNHKSFTCDQSKAKAWDLTTKVVVGGVSFAGFVVIATFSGLMARYFYRQHKSEAFLRNYCEF